MMRFISLVEKNILYLFVFRQYSVGFEMVTVSMVGDPGPAAFQKKTSGDYRYGSHIHNSHE